MTPIRQNDSEVQQSFRARPVLVIGGLGFIGINLIPRLLELGARVTVVTPSRDRHRMAVPWLEQQGARVVEGDLRDPSLMAASVRDQEIIFNLAGQSGAVRSMEDPWTDLDVNCRGSLVLLEAVRVFSPSARIVFPGSRLQYGRAVALPIGEAHAMDPACIHGIHKIAAESYLMLYHRLYGLNTTAVRITNPYGPGQPSARVTYGVVNHLIHLALADKPMPIYGDGAQLRDYIFIGDVVSALVRLGATASSAGQIYNLGSGVGTQLVDMARLISDIAGGGRLEFVPWPSSARQVETGDFVADITRITRDLDWRPAFSLHDGLQRTVEFYRRQPQESRSVRL